MEVYLPDLYALVALLAFSASALIIRAGSREYSAYSASVLISWGNLFLLGAVGLWRTPLSALTPTAVLYFLGSGVFGYTLSRSMLYLGFERLGVARTTALHGASPFFSVGLAILLLREQPGVAVFIGMVGIACGVWLISEEKGAGAWNRRDVLYPLAAAVGTSFSMIFRKKGLLIVDAPALGTAVSCLVAVPLVPAMRRFVPGMEGFRCARRGGLFLAGAAIANSLAQISLMRSLLTAGVAHTVPIYSASPLVVLLLAAIFLRRAERVSARLIWAVLLTVSGAVLITASRHGFLS